MASNDNKEEEDDYDGPWIEKRLEWKCPDRKRHQVTLFGSWNRFKGGDDLEYQGKQLFACTVKLPLGNYVYRFLIDSEDWETHNNAPKTARNGIEYNEIFVTENSDEEHDDDFVQEGGNQGAGDDTDQANTTLIYEDGKLTIGPKKKKRGRPSVELDLGSNFATDAENTGYDYGPMEDPDAQDDGGNEADNESQSGSNGGTSPGPNDKKKKKKKKKKRKKGDVQQEKEWARYVFVQQLRQQQQHNDEINRVKTLWKQERQVRVEMHKKVVKQLKETKKKLQEQKVEIERLEKTAKVGKDGDEKLSSHLKEQMAKLEQENQALMDKIAKKDSEFTEYRKARINDDKQSRQNNSEWESKERKYTKEINALNAEIKSLKTTQDSLQSNINTVKDGGNKALELKAKQFVEREKQWKLEKADFEKQLQELKKLKNKISKLESAMQTSKNETMAERKKVTQETSKTESLQSKVSELQSTLDDLRNSSEAAQKMQLAVNKIKLEKDAECAKLTERCNSTEKQLSEQKKFYDGKLAELTEANKAEVAALQANSDAQMTEHINKLKADVSARDDELGKAQEEIGKLQGGLNEEKVNNDGLNNKINGLNEELEAMKKDKECLDKEFENLKAEFEKLGDESKSSTSNANAVKAELEGKLGNLEEELAKCKETMESDSKSSEERQSMLEGQIADLKASLDEKNVESEGLNKELTDTKTELDALKNSDVSLREQVTSLQDEISKEQELVTQKTKEFEEEITKITNDLNAQIDAKNEEMNKINEELTNVKKELSQKLEEFASSETKLQQMEINLNAEKQKLENERTDHEQTVAVYIAKEDRIHNACKSLFAKFTGIRSEMKSIQETQIAQLEEVHRFFSDFSPLLGKVLKFNQSMIDDLLGKYKRELSLRRKYFNMVQDLRGNIRVFCRVRPILPFETKQNYGSCMKFPQEGQLKIYDKDKNGKKKEYTFEFDQVYVPDTTQEQVSEDSSEYIQSVMDGYNVSIFAYGQTGSGKTYTMDGDDERKKPGVNLRALKHLFKIAAERVPQFQYKIKVAIFEIYCEAIRDLIIGAEEILHAKKGKKGKKNAKPAKKKKQEKYKIRHLPDGSVEVVGLTWVHVKTDEDVLKLSEIAKSNRSATATKMNDRSSRSHMLLVVDVHGINIPANIKYFGKLYLVDLAGSERVKKSGATGDAMKEAKNINKSLSALGDVMQALQRKEKFVPYRNSTLTDLMANALGGNAKTIMFINCCPTDAHAFETVSSLKFAQRVGKVELGQAKKNTKK